MSRWSGVCHCSFPTAMGMQRIKTNRVVGGESPRAIWTTLAWSWALAAPKREVVVSRDQRCQMQGTQCWPMGWHGPAPAAFRFVQKARSRRVIFPQRLHVDGSTAQESSERHSGLQTGGSWKSRVERAIKGWTRASVYFGVRQLFGVLASWSDTAAPSACPGGIQAIPTCQPHHPPPSPSRSHFHPRSLHCSEPASVRRTAMR